MGNESSCEKIPFNPIDLVDKIQKEVEDSIHEIVQKAESKYDCTLFIDTLYGDEARQKKKTFEVCVIKRI